MLSYNLYQFDKEIGHKTNYIFNISLFVKTFFHMCNLYRPARCDGSMLGEGSMWDFCLLLHNSLYIKSPRELLEIAKS